MKRNVNALDYLSTPISGKRIKMGENGYQNLPCGRNNSPLFIFPDEIVPTHADFINVEYIIYFNTLVEMGNEHINC